MKNSNLEVILDFDYTIFDAKRFRLGLGLSLVNFGVSHKIFHQTYSQAVEKKQGQYSYSLQRHINLIKNHHPDLPRVPAILALKNVIRHSNKFIYKDTLAFLKALKKKGFKIILVTHGNPNFQRQKLEYSGLKKYFSKVILSPEIKAVTLKRIESKFGRAFFVSDHITELVQIKRNLPKLIPIMKTGSHYSDIVSAKKMSIPTFKSLSQIGKYIIKETNNRVQ